jgi:hypothetical protein
MYDGNPRTHLIRASALLASASENDYATLRYAALDTRLAVETTLQEVLSSCYVGYEPNFESLWRPKGKAKTPSFISSIRKQQPDFDLKNQLVPVVLKKKQKIMDYPAMDLDRLATIHHSLGGHLHHGSRYETKKARTRTKDLDKLLREALSYLTHLLHYPRYWVEFYDQDQKRFEDVVAGKFPIADFVRHIERGGLKSFAIKNVHHLQEGA